MICNGQVLALKDGEHPRNNGLFQKFHQKGNAVVVYGVQAKRDPALWTPDNFSKHFGMLKYIIQESLTFHRSLARFLNGTTPP